MSKFQTLTCLADLPRWHCLQVAFDELVAMTSYDQVESIWQKSNELQDCDEFRSNRCKWRLHKWHWPKSDSYNCNRNKATKKWNKIQAWGYDVAFGLEIPENVELTLFAATELNRLKTWAISAFVGFSMVFGCRKVFLAFENCKGEKKWPSKS